MAMESSIFPVPSEIVIPPAAFWQRRGNSVSQAWCSQACSGHISGSAITYWVSRLTGRPLIVKYGRFCAVDAEKLEQAEQWLARYEAGAGSFCNGSSRDSAFDFDSGGHCSDELRTFQSCNDCRIGPVVLDSGLS